MDTEHRHDLEQNDLEQFLAHFKEWWSKWGNSILTAVLVVLLVVVVWRFIENRRAAIEEQNLSGLYTETSPEGMRDFARGVSDPAVQARAYLRAADMLLIRASLPAAATGSISDPDAQTPAPAEREPRSELEEALAIYQQVATTKGVHPVVRLNAELGRAAVIEGLMGLAGSDRAASLRKEAGEVYTSIATEAAPSYPAIAARARQRRALLDELARPMIFGPDLSPQGAAESESGSQTTTAPEAGSAASTSSAAPSASVPTTDAPQPTDPTPAPAAPPATPPSP